MVSDPGLVDGKRSSLPDNAVLSAGLFAVGVTG